MSHHPQQMLVTLLAALLGVAALLVVAFKPLVRHLGAVGLRPVDGKDFLPKDVDMSRPNVTLGVLNLRRVPGFAHVYRSGAPNKVTDAAKLQERLQLAKTLDLRSDVETANAPVPAMAGVEHVWTPVYPVQRRSEMIPLMLRVLLFRASLHSFFGRTYPFFLRVGAGAFARIVAEAAEAELSGRAVLIHCSAGKDRTGLAAAFLLHLVNADEEAIVHDYALSNRAFPQLLAHVAGSRSSLRRRFGVDDRQLASLLVADPAWLTAAMDGIRKSYGSIERYLVDAGGLDPEVPARLRKAYAANAGKQLRDP